MPLINLQLRPIETADLEEIVVRLQKPLPEVAAGVHPLTEAHQESQIADPEKGLPEPEIDSQEPASPQGAQTRRSR